MESKPVLYVDVDSTIADTMPWWLSLYNVDNCTSWQKSQIKTWELPMNLEKYFTDYRGVDWVVGAKKAITNLSIYYRIVFATAGYGREWLTYRRTVGENDFIQIKDKSLLRGFALIDDYDKNLLGFEGRKYLLAQPWNFASEHYQSQRWEEIEEDLLKYALNGYSDGVSASPV